MNHPSVRLWQQNNPDKVRAASLSWRKRNVLRVLFYDAQKRAKRLGLAWNLELFDISIPAVCPVLGIPLSYGVGKRTHNSASLDRLNPAKGYTYDNVCVISWRANDLKKNGTLDEFKKLVAYLESK